MSRKPKSGYFVQGQFVAYGSELDEQLTQRDFPSKTEQKRESAALQDLGAELAALPWAQIAKLDLPEKLSDALRSLPEIHDFEAKRRQRQYIGKLMRTVDPAPIQALLQSFRQGDAQATARLHLLEQWRTRLLDDDKQVGAWIALHPGADVQRLRALVRQARKDSQELSAVATPATGQTPRQGRAYRELFQFMDSQPELDTQTKP